jgi:hypothetical protein
VNIGAGNFKILAASSFRGATISLFNGTLKRRFSLCAITATPWSPMGPLRISGLRSGVGPGNMDAIRHQADSGSVDKELIGTAAVDYLGISVTIDTPVSTVYCE